MKSCFLIPFLVIGFSNLQAQIGRKSDKENIFEISTHSSWLYGIRAETDGKYPPYSSGKSSLITFDIAVGFRVKKYFWIYPTYSYGFPYRSTLLNNPQGDYLPKGYGFSIPYSNQNPDYLYSDNYADLSVRASIYQKSIGSFLPSLRSKDSKSAPDFSAGKWIHMFRR